MNCTSCGTSVEDGKELCRTCKAEEELRVRLKQEDEAAQEAYDQSLVGVRGWLAFFCFGTGILGPLHMLEDLNTIPEMFRESAGDPVAVTVAVFVSIAMILVLLTSIGLAAVLVFRIPWAPRAAKIFLVTIPLLAWTGMLADALMLKSVGQKFDWDSEVATTLVATTINSAIWFWYFSVSRRVKMTYSYSRRI